jgi:hypothetical protein
MSTTPKYVDDGWHQCGNCGTRWHGSALNDIEDMDQRIDPGGTVPSGECPDRVDCCGALCYPCKPYPKRQRSKEGMGKGFCDKHGEFKMDSEETKCPSCEDEDPASGVTA